MNDKEYELIGESIWDTYRNMSYILAEGIVGRLKRKVFGSGKGADTAKESTALEDTLSRQGKPKPKKTKKETPEERAARIARGLSAGATYGDY